MAFCRKCGERLIEQSRFCSRCGTSVTVSSAPGGGIPSNPGSVPAPPVAMTQPPPPAQQAVPAYRCPRCHSDGIQNIRVLYESGTARFSGSATTVGVAWSPGHGVGIGTAGTSMSGTQQSLLARTHGPPSLKAVDSVGQFFAFMVVAGSLFMVVVGFLPWASGKSVLATLTLVLLGLCGVWGGVALYRSADSEARATAEYNRTEWPRLYNEWQQCWLCHKCGFFGLLGPPQG